MRVLFADDKALLHDNMASWLRQLDNKADIRHARSFGDVRDALLANEAFDLLILDLNTPGMQGVFGVHRLSRHLGAVPLLVIANIKTPNVVRHCLDAGASGVIDKSSSRYSFMNAVRAVLSGNTSTPPHIKLDAADPLELNEKQMQLLALLAEGLSNRDIALTMHLSEGTIKQYVSKILRLLDVSNRTEAGLKACELLGIDHS